MRIVQSSVGNRAPLQCKAFGSLAALSAERPAVTPFPMDKALVDMKILTTAALSLALMAAIPAKAQSIGIMPNGSRPSAVGSPQYFTGAVVVDPLFGVNAHTQVSGGHVTFAPGARSAWHTHPVGQVLIVTSGKGWVQEWGSEKRAIQSGDVVWIPPGVKHWHGASATNGMGHTAIQEARDGSAVEWMEQVSDAQYRK